jgi:hypothetical protein
MDIQLVQAIFRNNSVNMEKQPDRRANLLQKTNCPEVYAYMTWQRIMGRREEENVQVF